MTPSNEHTHPHTLTPSHPNPVSCDTRVQLRELRQTLEEYKERGGRDSQALIKKAAETVRVQFCLSPSLRLPFSFLALSSLCCIANVHPTHWHSHSCLCPASV